MLATDLTLNPNTTIAQGTDSAVIYSLLSNNNGKSTRSAASLSQTNPRQLSIAHSTRTSKGFKTAANASVPAPDVIFDRHLIRLDSNVEQASHLDPEYRVSRSIQIVIETPRMGADSPTSLELADDLKGIVSMLDASTRANLNRILNGEV